MAVDVRSLYNVGAIFRASDAARVRHLHLCGLTGHPGDQRDRIDKTALGAVDSVAWTHSRDPLWVIDALRAEGVTVAALELTPDSVPLHRLEPSWFPLALVVGHETDGVPAAVLARCDLAVAIATYGRKLSLNVALAYGVGILHAAQIWAASLGEAAETEDRG